MTGRGLLLLVVASLLVGCSGDAPRSTAPAAATPTPSVRTLSPLPAPPTPPATGRLYAEVRQSSRDVALGRMQVWLRNDTERDLTPTRIVYRDGRFRAPLSGERLRATPARSERGFPLTLPSRPRCGEDRPGRPRLVVTYADRAVVVPVTDVTDVAGRYASTRCLELAVASVATLSWSEEVPVEGTGVGTAADLVLRIEPTGRSASRLRLLTVGGTPLLTPQDGAVWTLDRTVRAGDPVREVPLRMIPSRCDEHVFMESGGATTFRVRLRLDGRPGDLLLRMSPAGAAAAIAFARDSCGLG